MTYRIAFRDVGRDKRSWLHCPEGQPEGDSLLAVIVQQAKRNGGLMSRDVDALWHAGYRSGAIYAGLRPVGEFHVEAMADAGQPTIYDIPGVA